MPTYEYACTSCHRHVEATQRFSDPPLTECEHCGGTLKRVFHPVGIVLKGSGFYATDSRSGKSLSSTKKDGDGAKESKPGETKTGGETKTETKSDTKTATGDSSSSGPKKDSPAAS